MLLTRRRFVQGTAGLAGAAFLTPLLAACSSDEGNKLAFLNWQDYIDPKVLEDFTQRTGAAVTYQTYASNDELQSLLVQADRARRGGRKGKTYDLAVPSDNVIAGFLRDDLIQELDLDRIPNLDNLASQYLDRGYDPGNHFSVPWATGTTGIGFDTKVFDEPPDWTVFLDAKHKDRMTILDEKRDAFGLALLSLGLDPNSTSQEDIDKATERLLEMKEQILGFDSSTYLDKLANGDLDCAHAYSSDLLEAQRTRPSLAFTLPPQGALRWVDNLVVPTDAPRKSTAEDFINFYLQPDVSAEVMSYVLVDTGNEKAYDLISQDLKDNQVVFPPPEVTANLQFLADLGDDEARYTKAWEKVTG
ncbi:MAG TPA: spermidine/putrescine ABC transporter substrate-binding protein [Acidimicrobiales bacterium]|nr:spermidine/putrescine ABC transporter substrate-binding protein [Acidimicrobiales bacterium]